MKQDQVFLRESPNLEFVPEDGEECLRKKSAPKRSYFKEEKDRCLVII